MTSLEQFRSTFFQECDEQIAALEPVLSMLVGTGDQSEALNAAFRAIHSIKGGAGMFGFKRLIEFSHAFESALEALRSGAAHLDAERVEKLLLASDVLADLVEAARRNVELPERYEFLARQDLALISGAKSERDQKPESAALGQEATGSVVPKTYEIIFKPEAGLLRRGIEPLTLFRNLSELGELTACADTEGLPPLADLDPLSLYISWRLTLTTTASVKDIRNIFEFATDSAALQIICRDDADQETRQAEAGKRTPSAPATAKAQSIRHERTISSIRVDLDRVDRLVDLIGEMTIAQSMVLQHLDQAAIDTDPLLYRALSQLQQLTRGLQDGVMSIRAQPVRSVFARMPSVAREVAQAINRRVSVELIGEETEIDKTIIEQLSDPLIHIIRNAIGHGIEQADERRRLGKPETGLVRLSAAQRGGCIVIEVSDDGRGIDREAVLKRAIEQAQIATDAILTDEEIDNLIFLPGLSTAQEVSDISGRGVGMDVVQRNIQAIGGRVYIQSEWGVGTTTTIQLPLTLAVLDGMLVRAGKEAYLIPLSNVAECMILSRHQINKLAGTGDVISIRGRHVRAIDLASQLGLRQTSTQDILQVVVVRTETGGLIGVIVDEILGSQQIVIKSIKGACGELQGIAGATILGDGSIALILDVNQLSAINSNSRFPPKQHLAKASETHAA